MIEKITNVIKKSFIVLEKAVRGFVLHESPYWAASMAYYGLLSLFPILLFVLYFGSAILETEATRDVLIALLEEFFPIGVSDINDVIKQTLAVRSSIGVVGSIGLLWTGSSVFGVLARALNAIWGMQPRSFLRRRMMAALILFVLGVVFLMLFFISPIISALINSVIPEVQVFVVIIYELFLISLTSIMVYRIVPNCIVSWKAASIGGVISGAGIVLAKHIYVFYLSLSINNYGYVYGSLTWIVFIQLWAFVVAILFFFGAEVAAVLDGK